MQFLKKHYEKIILTVLLLVFVVSLIYLIWNIIFSSQIKLELPKNRADYQQKDFNQPQFKVIEEIKKAKDWLASKHVLTEPEKTSDLMVPFKVARSPHNPRKLIAFYYFDKELKGPFSDKKIMKPDTLFVDEDRDADGIPNDIETKVGLDPTNPEDGLGDIDEDGFINVDEFKEYGTEINNPKSHPPLALRLVVKKIRRTEMGIKLTKIRVTDKNNKSKWEIHLELKKHGVWRTSFPNVKDEITVDGKEYTIVDASYKYKEQIDPTIKTLVKVDQSEIVILPADKKDTPENRKKYGIIVAADKKVFAPSAKAFIQDIIDGKKLIVEDGKKFKLGNKELGEEGYITEKVDPQKYNVIIKDIKTGKEFTITRQPKIRERRYGKTPEGTPGGDAGLDFTAPPAF